MFLDDSIGHCYRVRCPVSSPSVGPITVGVIILGLTGFRGLDVQLESSFYLENFVSWPVVDHVAVGATVSKTAEFKILEVLPEFPLELAYDVCLVLHSLKLFCNGPLGHTVLNC